MTAQKPYRVLIAEDESLVSDVIQKQLRKIGHLVAGRAMDGLQALELTQSLQPDVVLMDIEMPEMDGLEATRLIQERCPRPVVMLTAHDHPGLVMRANQAGVGAFLVKPSNEREVERTLAIAVARFGDLMEARRRTAELQQTLSALKVLRGLLPICSGCKKIRDDQGDWRSLERYLMAHSEATFTHSLCPDCCRKYFPDQYDRPQ